MDKKLIKGVPYIDQTKEYPTGCESVTTVMLLQYLGIEITVDEFIQHYLEKSPMYYQNGELYGPNPREYFAGSPYDEDSFGCYAPVIVHSLQKIADDYPQLLNSNKKIVDISELPMEDVLKNFIDQDMPVIFWASIDLKKTIIGPDWKLTDSQEIFTWISNEHCMLLVGYDEEYYYFCDPWHNHGLIGYERQLVEQRHLEQYGMKVSIK